MKPFKNMKRMATLYRDFSKRRILCRGLPVRLWIETSSMCNLSCPICVNRDIPAAEKQNMDMALFSRIIDQAKAFAHDVNLHHRGEPLLNPDFPEMVRYAKKSGLAVRFHTNATLLNREQATRILAAGPDLISISFDGFAKEPYETIRKGARFEETVANICNLLYEKKKTNAKTYIMIERIAFAELERTNNQASVLALSERFHALGVDEIVTKAPFTWPAAAQGTPPERQVGRLCTFPWYAMVICADGTVTPCPQDGMAQMRLGNAGQQSLREIWNGPAYRDLRSAMIRDISGLPLCRVCDRLQRRQAGGLPLQYGIPFLLDMFAGYGKIRNRVGSFERNRQINP